MNCFDCGRFFSFAKRHAWKMVYSVGATYEPDREIYRCESCLEKFGPFEPQHNIRPEASCGITEPSA